MGKISYFLWFSVRSRVFNNIRISQSCAQDNYVFIFVIYIGDIKESILAAMEKPFVLNIRSVYNQPIPNQFDFFKKLMVNIVPILWRGSYAD